MSKKKVTQDEILAFLDSKFAKLDDKNKKKKKKNDKDKEKEKKNDSTKIEEV